MDEGEQQIAIAGVQYNRAGCLLLPIPLLTVKSAGALVVTNRKIRFEPVLFYKWLTKGFEFDLDQVAGADAGGSNVELSMWSLVNIGKRLTIRLKDGHSYTVRSTDADLLAEVINQLVNRPGQ